MKPGSIRLVAAAAGILWAVTSAHAFVIDEDGTGHPLHWAEMPVSYYMVTGNAPAGVDGEAAVHNAFETWNAASSNVQYDFGGYLPEGVQQLDSKNIVYWVDSGWKYDPTLAAITFRYYDTTDGHLLDADTAFNGEKYRWTADGTGYDIQNSATHEIGHMSGLGHSEDRTATMFAATASGETSKRTLAADDLAAIDAIYGGTTSAVHAATNTGASTPSVSGSSTGAVSGSGGGGGGGCQLGHSGRPTAPSDLLCSLALLVAIRFRQRGRARRAMRG